MQLRTVRREGLTYADGMTRSRVIQVWFIAVTLAVVGSIAFGVTVTVMRGALFALLSLVPAAIVLMLWPGPPRETAADVLYGRGRRG